MTTERAGTQAQVPLLIGVVGHRKLAAEQIDSLRAVTRRYLSSLRAQFPDAPLLLASTLGPGAGLLVVEEALAQGLDCLAVLPCAPAIYRERFDGPLEQARFEALLGRCRQHIVCPPLAARGSTDRVDSEPPRDRQFLAACRLIAADAFILLALWDGNSDDSATSSVVAFRLARRAWLDDEFGSPHHELLPDIPPDLVYHVVAQRAGTPLATGLLPVQEGYRSSIAGPLEARMPANARVVAERTSELNRDLRRHLPAAASADSSGAVGTLAAVPPGVRDIARLFDAVDQLASQMRHRVMWTLYCSSGLTVLMGAFFLALHHSANTAPYTFSIYGFLLAFLVLLCGNAIARRAQWHRRYLEFRAIAEGLRVELFWAIAGVRAHGATPAAHRTMLKQADPGLEWIPNAIRTVSMLLTDIRHAGIPGGVEFAMRKWVGTIGESGSRSEQLHYYWHACHQKARFATFAERLAGASVVVGLLVATVLAIEVALGRAGHTSELLFGMGFFSLSGGVIEALVQKTAERELERQYGYMYEVFLAAHDQLLAAKSDQERRSILALLGHAALAEHAEWLFVHRDRPIDRSRMQ